jgi:hypothetical protein
MQHIFIYKPKLEIDQPVRPPMSASSSWLPRQRASSLATSTSTATSGGGLLLTFRGELCLKGMEALTWLYGCGGLGPVSVALLLSAIEKCRTEHGNEVIMLLYRFFFFFFLQPSCPRTTYCALPLNITKLI